MQGRLQDGVANRVARYLPLGIPHETRAYVEHAVREGKISEATFRVKGNLADFPFYNARQVSDGEFRIAAKVEDVGFAFVPSLPASGVQPAYVSPWPTLAKVSGELVFDRASMEIRNARAQVGNIEWTKVQGGIKNLADHSVLAAECGALLSGFFASRR